MTIGLIREDRYNDISNSLQEIKKKTFKTYDLLIKYQDKKLSDLLDLVNKEELSNMTKNDIIRSINKMKQFYSVRKAEEMSYILRLAIALEEDDKEKTLLYKVKLNRHQAKDDEIKKVIRKNRLEKTHGTNSRTRQNDEVREQKIKDLTNEMTSISNNESQIKHDSGTKQFIKRYATSFDEELYADYFIKSNSIQEIKLSEIDQLLEVTSFFISNLDRSIEYFEKLDFTNKNDIQKIIGFKMNKEEELSEKYTKNIGNLYTWKLKRLKKLKMTYINYQEMLIKFKEEKNLSSYKILNELSRDTLREEKEDFIQEFYYNMSTAEKTYNCFFEGLNNFAPATKEKYSKTYMKKLIINNEEK